MRSVFREKCILSIILSAFIGMSACVQKTDADLIKELVDDMGKLIEKKDLPGLLNLLAEDYSDFTGRTKGQTEDMVKSYFNQFRGIVIHILHTRIDKIETQQASIQSDVALSSGAARAFRKFIRISTDNYRLRIKLIKKEDRWLIRYAEWTYIGLDELFPESLSILKKIFSDESPE
jgi:ketosteroid isomerase-like protein